MQGRLIVKLEVGDGVTEVRRVVIDEIYSDLLAAFASLGGHIKNGPVDRKANDGVMGFVNEAVDVAGQPVVTSGGAILGIDALLNDPPVRLVIHDEGMVI